MAVEPLPWVRMWVSFHSGLIDLEMAGWSGVRGEIMLESGSHRLQWISLKAVVVAAAFAAVESFAAFESDAADAHAWQRDVEP